MRSFWQITIIAALFLAGCGANASADSNLPFAFVTAAPNASPTPTPFQPMLWTPSPVYAQDGSLLSQPVADSALSTSTPPAPTQTPAPTIDPNLLINTVAPQATIDSSGSQVLNNGQSTVNFLLIGSDQRHGASFRTDTMVVAILHPNEGQVSLISIPRDLWVSIPTQGNQRINTAFEYGELNGYPG
ncbi:MAG: LCP family protein, partial [Chloroflexota bacterium]